MATSNKTLSFSLDDLGIPKSTLIENVPFTNVDVLNLLIINGISKESLGNKINVSEYFPGESSYNKFFESLSNDLGLPVIRESKFDFSTSDFNESIIIPDKITVLDFYEAIRNSIAHKNILYYKDAFIFFMAYAGKYNSKSIEKAWREKTKILIFLRNLDDISKLGEYILNYIKKPV